MATEVTDLFGINDPFAQNVLKSAKAKGEVEAAEKQEKAYGQQELAKAEAETTKKFAEEFQPKELKEKYEKTVDELGKPFIPTQQTAGDLGTIFAMTNILGFLIGGGAKGSAQAALSAQNGMLEGYQKGQQDVYKKQKDIFDENQKALSKAVESLRDELKRAADTASVNKELGLAQAREAIAKHQAKQMGEYLDKMGVAATYELSEKAWQINEKLKAENRAEEDRAERRANEQKRLGMERERLELERKKIDTANQPMPENLLENTAQAIASYSISPPGLRDKNRYSILAKVMEINPQWNENEYRTEGANMRYWTSGQGTKQIQSYNTISGHLDSLEEYANALNNKNVRLANAAFNKLQTAFGSDKVTNYDTAKQIVAGELVKAITATGGGVRDRLEAEENFKAANTPEQLQGAINVAKDLIKQRLNASKTAYEFGTKRKDFDSMLTDETKKMFTGGQSTGYTMGQEITVGNKKYRVVGLSNPNDPDLEEIK
jgi:hypothetical protein